MNFRRIPYLLLALALPTLPAVVRADEATDAKKQEIARKKEEAKKRADARAADKTAADKAAADKAAADKVAADKAAADKAAADKAAADKAAGSGGTGGATSTATGGAGGKGGAGGAGGKGSGGATSTTKVEEKDAPLPVGDIETLRKDRADRRKTTVERLRKRWGSVLANAEGAADLKLHSRRVAFLQRIRVLAEGKKDKKTIEAVDELLTTEDDRHSKAMNSLREGALSAGATK